MTHEFTVRNLGQFPKGWVVGHFPEALLHCDEAEVAIKHYKAGDYEPTHVHKVADEITIVIDGMIKMQGLTYCNNDVILMPKGMSTDFQALTDVTTCVIKLPSVKGDKYLV